MSARAIAVPAAVAERPRRLGGRREGAFAFLLSLAFYLGLGAYLVFVASTIIGDAWSRVGNAYYVLFSRDPHLAAIGFVWNPLPSLLMLPILPFQVLWPALATVGFSANILSALFMAGSVATLLGLLDDIGLGLLPRWTIAIVFACNPMIWLYGANGLSEGPFIFFVLVTARALLRWERRNAAADLVVAGLALGLAYMTRYEAVAVAGTSIAGVAILSGLRAQGPVRERVVTAVADALLVGFPFVVAFAGWSAASWIIVGTPFATFTSVYGNTSQVTLAGTGISDVTGNTTIARVLFFGRELFGVAPGLVLIAAFTVPLIVVRRTIRPFVPVAVFGAAIAFSGWALVSGSSFGWLRFAIMGIPLTAVLAGMVIAPRYGAAWLAGTQPAEPAMAAHAQAAGVEPGRRRRLGARLAAAAGRAVLVAAVTASLLAGYPMVYATMSDPLIGREEVAQLAALRAPATGGSLDYGRMYVVSREAAEYVDGLHAARGTVLIDVATGYPIVLQSRNPGQFVITPDRDFPQTLRDPGSFGIRYIFVPRGEGYASVDAIRRTYPGMFENGGGFATLVADFGSSGDFEAWRLYELNAGP